MTNPCSLCNAACCKDYIITTTSFDLVRIIDSTEMAADSFAALYPAKMLNLDESTVLECYDSKGYRYDYVLALKSHPCIFLENDNKCKIHKVAPFTCRRYPVSQNGSIFERASCNLISKMLFKILGVHLKKEEHISQIDRYRTLVSKWNKKRGKKGDCIAFLLEESKLLKTIPTNNKKG